MESSAAMQQSCILMAKEIVSCFPMNKAEDKNAEKQEVEEVNEEEEKAMQQSCTCGPWLLFPSREQGIGEEKGGGGDVEEGIGGKHGE